MLSQHLTTTGNYKRYFNRNTVSVTQVFVEPTLSQFRQHFTRAFFIHKCFEQLFSSYILTKKALSYEKHAHKMLMKLIHFIVIF